jgi:Predicted secreted protein
VKAVRDRHLAVLTIAFALFACVGLVAAYAFSVKGSTNIFDERNNAQTIAIKNGATFKVVLDENPANGYSWNISATSGLTIVNDAYTSPDNGLADAGGHHTWEVKATGAGDQQFTGTCNEGTYRLSITIE